MTDSTDNARGPERIWAMADRRRQWFDKDPHDKMIDGHTVEYIRADLAPDPLSDARVVALVEAFIIATGQIDTPIGRRKLGLDPHGEVILTIRAALAAFNKGDKTDG
jgi:hypothetical protein